MALTDKVVVITGGSSGIGAITAQMLSEQGATVILAARSKDKLKQVSTRMMGPHLVVEMDVADQESVDSGFNQIFKQYGRVDCLINNAGYGIFEYCDEMPVEQFEQMMNVNYVGTVRCTKAVLPYMKQVCKGRIVNVASIAGKIGTPKSTAYTATKHAVLGFSNALRQEVRDYSITVSTINPGPIDTPFFQIADPEGDYVNNVKWFMLKPERVANVIVNAVRTGRAETSLPWTANIGAKFIQLFPRFGNAVSYRLLNKK